MEMFIFLERIEALVKARKIITDKFFELPPEKEETNLREAYVNLGKAFNEVIMAEASQLLSEI